MSSSPDSSASLPALVPPARVRAYDLGAWFYDLLVGSRLYHNIVWGMPPDQHLTFARRAIQAAPSGAVLDAGCGSLLFTAPCYRDSDRELTLLDASCTMLARAARRLGPASRARLIHGDLRALPFEAERFAATLHFGVLHCLDEADRALEELFRVTRPGGKLFLSCLTLARPRGDAFLRRLARAGHVARPRHPQDVLSAIAGAGFHLVEQRQRGSFLFVEALRLS
jgi:ubiquinone/menaquinone biosynthesis C-methylase UbiE